MSSTRKINNIKILLQVWNLENDNWDNTLDIYKYGFSTSKSWIDDEKNQGLAFCIVKGKREFYGFNKFSNYEQLPKTNKTIHILWQKFYVQNVTNYGSGNYKYYYVSGEKRATIFKEKPIVLDAITNFATFERKYMRTGMTNIANDETGVTKELLRLSDELKFYPGF
ncbi:hypothetical protein [Nostoc favosum]|uniref:Uncharacterized protein n=1 Tax=Nostoc favosum CHAB5714 TaxID=2780399 RepID=A0ABS8I8L9_9NOSO|nr:hypothetical protein [Nostoc favosum]MCC5600519.1 hypothetical protein [Nostoc favosum CHAB5714]